MNALNKNQVENIELADAANDVSLMIRKKGLRPTVNHYCYEAAWKIMSEIIDDLTWKQYSKGHNIKGWNKNIYSRIEIIRKLTKKDSIHERLDALTRFLYRVDLATKEWEKYRQSEKYHQDETDYCAFN